MLAIQGGLGNQLFQWALGTSLRRRGIVVHVDTSRCRGDRPLAIDPLLDGWPRSPRTVGLWRIALHKARLLGRFGTLPVIEETGMRFDPDLQRRAAAGGMLLGYFQSPRYFEDVASEVRGAVRGLLDAALTPSGRALAADLAQDPRSVAVHVRRGDYVTSPTASAHHGVLGVDHYERALAAAGAHGGTRRIWFSDDPAWVRDHLLRPGDQLVPAGTTSAPAGDIALMARCRTRVIANSSFSWWAGWLGPGDDRDPGTVIAPRRWFAGSDEPANDLIPASWIRVPSTPSPAFRAEGAT